MNINYLKIISFFLLGLMSCSKENESDINDKNYAYIRNEYSGIKNLSQTYFSGTYWQEAEYQLDNIADYAIHFYYLKGSNNQLSLYKDGNFIGYFCIKSGSKLYFKSETSDEKILYDFKINDLLSDGYYLKTYVPSPYICEFKDFKLPNNYIQGVNTHEGLWRYDEYGGITISNIGSTAGILAPILEKRDKNTIIELIRFSSYIYSSVGTFQTDERMIDDNYDYGLYSNLQSPICDYLPSDFWILPYDDIVKVN